jgi:hypothetical protein
MQIDVVVKMRGNNHMRGTVQQRRFAPLLPGP